MSEPVRTKRPKTSVACSTCRRRKVKCDGIFPACSRCQKREHLRHTCSYAPCTTSSNHGAPPDLSRTPASLTEPSTAAFGISTSLRDVDRSLSTHDATICGDPDSRGFIHGIKTAIETRFGLPIQKKLAPIPLLDAPLFGENLNRMPPANQGSLHLIDNALPPRNHADQLVDVYWQYLDPIFSILDRDRFSRSYQLLFSGGELDCDEKIFISTINFVFAWSIQLREKVPPSERIDVSRTFFQRGWSLLRPETIIWGPGSLELVQCLLLLGTYLSCTSNLHNAYMTVGSATRIALSIGLNLPSNDTALDSCLRWKVWRQCVWLERKYACVLGRPSPPLSLPVRGVISTSQGNDQLDTLQNTHEIKMLELTEIFTHISLSQTATSNTVAQRLGLPPLLRNTDFWTIMHIDKCLNNLVKDLVPPLRCDEDCDIQLAIQEGKLDAQGIALNLRVLHLRLHLFRPTFCRFCLPQYHAGQTTTSNHSDLEARMTQDCATLCVEASKRIVDLVCDCYNPEAEIGILPWWDRVVYLYIACQHLLAAMLRPDIFKTVVPGHWRKAMSTLHAHEQLGPAVAACISGFETMWQQITDMQHPTVGSDAGLPSTVFSNTNAQDFLQSLGFESDEAFLNFGLESTDSANFEWRP